MALVKSAGYETVDIASSTPVADQIEKITGKREVDCGVDAVGFECHGNGPGADEDPSAVINALFEVVRANGAMGIPGIYCAGDPKARNEDEQQGRYGLDFGKAWIKSPHLTVGQCPVMHYHRDLMQAILWDRMPYLSKLLNVQVIGLDDAIEAYRIFDGGLGQEIRHRPSWSDKDGDEALGVNGKAGPSTCSTPGTPKRSRRAQ